MGEGNERRSKKRGIGNGAMYTKAFDQSGKAAKQ